ncbi:hypothetical protein D3C85_1196040 [compost metagenome]
MHRVLGLDFLWQPHLGKVMSRPLQCLRPADTEHAHRALDDVFQHGHVAPQIEVLEHHRQPAAQAPQLPGVNHTQLTPRVSAGEQLFVIDDNAPGRRLFKMVDTTQEGTFPGPGGADDADHITRPGLERNPFQHFMVAIVFMDIFNDQFIHSSKSDRGQCVRGLR